MYCNLTRPRALLQTKGGAVACGCRMRLWDWQSRGEPAAEAALAVCRCDPS